MDASQESAGAPAGSPATARDGTIELVGSILHVTYFDERTLYTVLRVSLEGGAAPPQGAELFGAARVTAVGRSPEAHEGTRVRMVGQWKHHATHGQQFEFEYLLPLPPLGADGLVRYLSSKTFHGIGKKLAERIVETLGGEALERIAEDPACLATVRGLTPARAAELSDSIRAQSALHRTYAFLLSVGLGPHLAQAVLQKLGPDCERTVRADPFCLTQVHGVGFLTADRAAAKLEVPPDDPRRISAVLWYVLEQAADEGHTYLPLGELLAGARRTLQADAPLEAFHAALDDRRTRLVVERERSPDAERWDERHAVYPVGLLRAERELARGIRRLLHGPEALPLADEAALRVAEAHADVRLSDEQRGAVLRLLSSPIAVLTGGPGVGKTTIVRFVASLAEAAGCKVLLASPTGRAAKRLSEATGRAASTVHRMLKFQPADGGFAFHRDHPLSAGLVLVDEISMLDVALARRLVDAVEAPTRLLLVGDPDQLPSVGPGNVLADLLASGALPVARLTQIYRQGRESLIVENAHRVLRGEMPVLPERGDLDADFYLFPCDDPAETQKLTVDVVARRIPETFGVDWYRDVQVIAPMYRGDCGVDALNDRLREALGAAGREVVHGEQRWRTGDRVIQTRNDYEREVFNGDMGRVESVSPTGEVTVRFQDQDVVYARGALSDLRPAFAITVHRSQGAEFPVVVLPLSTAHRAMLQRNLLYTALTRAQRLVVLVGSRRALSMAVGRADQARRLSGLADRLREAPPDPAADPAERDDEGGAPGTD